MNEGGDLNLTRFEIYLTELSKYDHQRYENENDTFKNLDKLDHQKKNSSKTKSQLESDDFDFSILDKLTVPPTTNNDNLDKIIPNEQKSLDISSLSDENDLSSSSSTISEESDGDDNPNESKNSSKILNEDDIDKMPLIEAEFRQHKNHYYREKMKINFISSDQLQIYVDEYIEALQWILKYYYQGCPSWSWFYPHHYAPYLSDLINFKHLQLTFQRGTPFKPFEQLLGKFFNLEMNIDYKLFKQNDIRNSFLWSLLLL
jgi:5'-3' exoribonuclease 1